LCNHGRLAAKSAMVPLCRWLESHPLPRANGESSRIPDRPKHKMIRPEMTSLKQIESNLRKTANSRQCMRVCTGAIGSLTQACTFASLAIWIDAYRLCDRAELFA
jgi:hypothetical protein